MSYFGTWHNNSVSVKSLTMMSSDGYAEMNMREMIYRFLKRKKQRQPFI